MIYLSKQLISFKAPTSEISIRRLKKKEQAVRNAQLWKAGKLREFKDIIKEIDYDSISEEDANILKWCDQTAIREVMTHYYLMCSICFS